MAGIIYVLSNQNMPDLVKIGCSTADYPGQYIAGLYTQGVPTPFECIKAVRVDNEVSVEKAIHIAFEPSRVSPDRSFFRLKAEQIMVLLDQFSDEDVTEIIAQECRTALSSEMPAGKRAGQAEKTVVLKTAAD